MQLFPINMEDENVKKYTLKRVITALFIAFGDPAGVVRTDAVDAGFSV